MLLFSLILNFSKCDISIEAYLKKFYVFLRPKHTHTHSEPKCLTLPDKAECRSPKSEHHLKLKPTKAKLTLSQHKGYRISYKRYRIEWK